MEFQRLGASGSARDTLPQNATSVPTLDSMLKMTEGLAQQGYAGGSATNRQAISNEATYAQLRQRQKESDQAESDSEQEQRGILSQLISEYDDILDTADPNDPIFQQRAPTLLRKREQLIGLMNNKKYGGPRLSGILKRGFDSQFLNPVTQGEVGEMVSEKSESKKQSDANKGQSAEKQKAPEEGHSAETDSFYSSSNTINID
jgi:hypothetical protein